MGALDGGAARALQIGGYSGTEANGEERKPVSGEAHQESRLEILKMAISAKQRQRVLGRFSPRPLTDPPTQRMAIDCRGTLQAEGGHAGSARKGGFGMSQDDVTASAKTALRGG